MGPVQLCLVTEDPWYMPSKEQQPSAHHCVLLAAFLPAGFWSLHGALGLVLVALTLTAFNALFVHGCSFSAP